MSITSILRPFFSKRLKEIGRYELCAEEIQRNVLAALIQRARNTEWGVRHGFDRMQSYEDFAANSKVTTYEDLKGDVDRMRRGEKDVLWPGKVKWYAKSSGTTADKSKFIPVSAQGLRDTH